MTITANQLAQRAEGIGASEVAAVLGLDPYRTAYDVWAEKTGKIVRADDPPSAAAEMGNLLEPVIGRMAEAEIGSRVVRPTGTYKSDNGVMLANLDFQVGRAQRGADIVEAKSTHIAEGWGEAGSCDVPERVYLQVHAQMLCSASLLAYVARLCGRFGFEFALYRVPFNARLAHTIEDGVCAFWHNHVVKDIPPEDSVPSEETYKRFRRVARKSVAIAAELVADWRAKDAAAKTSEKLAADAKARVIAALGDAEEGTSDAGRVTYFEATRGGFDAERFRKDHPDLAAMYARQTVYRTCRFVPAKEVRS